MKVDRSFREVVSEQAELPREKWEVRAVYTWRYPDGQSATVRARFGFIERPSLEHVIYRIARFPEGHPSRPAEVEVRPPTELRSLVLPMRTQQPSLQA